MVPNAFKISELGEIIDAKKSLLFKSNLNLTILNIE